MANVRSANTWFIDTSSSSGTATSFLTDKNLRLVGLVFTVTTAGTDVIDIYDKNATSSAAGSYKLTIKSSTDNNTNQLRLDASPILFPNGVWVTLTGTPKVTLIFGSQQGT